MKKAKRVRVLAAITAVVFVVLTAVAAAEAFSAKYFIDVRVNGKLLRMDSEPYFLNSRVMVPVFFIGEALDARVEWLGEERKVVINDGRKNIELFIGSNRVIVNEQEKQMDVPAEIRKSRTMVPVRFIAEYLGCTVEWDPLTYTVLIYKEGADVPALSIAERSYTDEDLLWLGRIVNVEGMNLSLEGKVAIANVVLNRVKSSIYPNSVYEVIFDTNYTVQFPPAHKEGFRLSIPGTQSVVAAKMALEGINNIGDCLYFNNKPFKWKKPEDLYRVIEGEYFYR